MFIHNLKYSLKILFRNKSLIFWSFIFPIILVTFFKIAFSNISEAQKLKPFNIAVVEDENFKNDIVLSKSIEKLSDLKNNDRLFNTQYVDITKANDLLISKDIVGYLVYNNKFEVVVNKNGINETIFKDSVEQILQDEEVMNNIVKNNISNMNSYKNYPIDYELIYQNATNLIQNQKANIVDISNNNLDFIMIEYYTVIAMTCLYGSMTSLLIINYNLANMSNKGKRIFINPTSKSKMIFSGLLASYIVQIIGLALLYLYTIFVLKIDYGNNLLLVILLSLIGSIAGLALGVFVGTIVKSDYSKKLGILIPLIIFGCFLSGMMGVSMKYIIDENLPILNKVNPANMITDAFYSLGCNTLNRYWFNILSLLIFSFILISLSIIVLRRQRYDNI